MENEINQGDFAKTNINSVEDAVQAWIKEQDFERVVEFLKNNREDIGEFCMQTFEVYQKGDHAGIYQLSILIDKLIK